jgi:hypothetical protein
MTEEDQRRAGPKATLPQILDDVAEGQKHRNLRVTNGQSQLVSPAPKEESVEAGATIWHRKGDGFRIIDPHAFDPMTDEEVDAFLEGRY